MIRSNTTGIWYDPDDCVFFRNCIQSAFYLEWGATLVDLFTDSFHKLVFVFTKEDHKKYIDRWMTQKKDSEKNE